MRDEDLLRRLREHLASTDEAEELLPTVRRLNQWQALAPAAEDTACLLETLMPAMPAHAPQSTVRYPNSAFGILHSSVLLLRAQLRVVRNEVWAASVFVMALGAAVTLTTFQPASSGSTLPLVLTAPFVAAVGVTFLYGPFVDPALEIELTTPVSPRLVLLARLVLVFGYDLALGMLASLALTIARAEISFWPLVTAWLAPMAFLSALALLLSVLTADPTLGILVSLGLWFLQVMRQSPDLARLIWFVPNLLTAEAHLWLGLSAALLGTAALWLGGREERWLGRSE